MKIIINNAIKVVAIILAITAIINSIFIILCCISKQNDNIINAIVVTIIMQLITIALSMVIFKVHFKLIIKTMLLVITCSTLVATYFIPIVISKKPYTESNEKFGWYTTGTETRYKNLYGKTLKGERTYHDWHHGGSGTIPIKD